MDCHSALVQTIKKEVEDLTGFEADPIVDTDVHGPTRTRYFISSRKRRHMRSTSRPSYKPSSGFNPPMSKEWLLCQYCEYVSFFVYLIHSTIRMQDNC